jgi:hypothetical protein
MDRRLIRSLGAGAMAVASTTASAAPAPDLVGKSIVVTWSEGRQQRVNDAPGLRSVTVSFNLGIYVSGAGRPFTRLTSTGGRGSVSSNEQVGGTGASLGGGARSVRVDGRTVLLQADYGNFARSLRVDVSPGGGGCNAQMSVGKQVGSTPKPFRNQAGMTIEIHSVSVSGTSCSIRDGNLFAR